MMKEKMIVGWRETLSLPGLGINKIKAKIDTGARTSCLHAFRLETFERDGAPWVRFWIHPKQRNEDQIAECEAPIVDERIVRDSGGHEEKRYVIRTDICLGGQSWPAEITLTNRENMAFRMLLGRTAMHQRIVVDPVESFLIPFEETEE